MEDKDEYTNKFKNAFRIGILSRSVTEARQFNNVTQNRKKIIHPYIFPEIFGFMGMGYCEVGHKVYPSAFENIYNFWEVFLNKLQLRYGRGQNMKAKKGIVEFARRLFGFEKIESREVVYRKYKTGKTNPYNLEKVVDEMHLSVIALSTDMNWVKRFLWVIIGLLFAILIK